MFYTCYFIIEALVLSIFLRELNAGGFNECFEGNPGIILIFKYIDIFLNRQKIFTCQHLI